MTTPSYMYIATRVSLPVVMLQYSLQQAWMQ